MATVQEVIALFDQRICEVPGAHRNETFQAFIKPKKYGNMCWSKIGGSWSRELAQKQIDEALENRAQWPDPLAGNW